MTLQPTYREWKIEDTDEIQKVLYNTWVASYADFIPLTDIQWYFNNYYSEISFAQLFDDPSSSSIVAQVKKHIVAYARIKCAEEENRCFLESLYVLPQFQGRGIGLELLSKVEQKAAEGSYKQLWLRVMSQNNPSIQWYKKLGFQFVEESPFVIGKSTVKHLVGYKDIQL